MTRIIAGFAGSLTLQVPRVGTRPTSDRVREAIFSALSARGLIDGARVLDLYAGSGALGLEAASRGASTVMLVEKSHAAVQVCKRNAELVRARARGDEPRITVSGKPVQSFLTSTAGASAHRYDLVLVDPPYELGGLELDHVLAALVPHLAPGAVVVLERSSRSAQPEWPAGLALDRRTDYGETAVLWLSASSAGDAGDAADDEAADDGAVDDGAPST
ncbi:16S rRNA (guanine(966)-N(2))-methyltransferase RsmD [Microcella daejeonensis]|uniref:16S rRNA (guanine(966)-N(2))-methyltransferase RsmD n=1 Tax=Microcella daejeonensis TaxID=2994971 RepID=UPI00227191A4|nr:16S rRNA (guanine(966)-N(2))-methyltransferase RsmD [Microcella daejeonensis]WAB83838.1 16S rRNA (guanine(966)-N(2))-methyltransferase RsmD [Microcella daejeonensis]